MWRGSLPVNDVSNYLLSHRAPYASYDHKIGVNAWVIGYEVHTVLTALYKAHKGAFLAFYDPYDTTYGLSAPWAEHDLYDVSREGAT
jgi:hypothetical protein